MSRRNELKQILLRHLLLYGKATRPELVNLTGIRAATVFEAIDELKAEGIIQEPERKGKKTGRKAPELFCSADCCHIVGVELHLTGCTGVIIDANGEVIHSVVHPATERRTLVEVKREILEVLQHLRELAGENWHLVRGLGFADPGLVDIEKNRSIRAVNIPPWQELDTGKMLENASGLPSQIWPEAMVKTRMEFIQRLPDAPESIFNFVTENGIGGGFIKKGELFVGSSGRAMEIGHIVVHPGGVRCQCGNCGCLESVASPAGLAEKIAESRAAGVDLGGLPVKFSMEVFAEYAARNRGVRIIADELCRDLGNALSVAVMLLNPEMIVISGEFASLGTFLTDSLRRELELRCFPEAVKELKIEISTLAPADTARGAAMMMRDRVLLGECGNL
ncbi:MAG: ROK family protein [Lentisphaerae bacterium]|nr:ROK family protein [Lentisphaerota bacterium]MBQ4328154.1 ROK family protein [Lentisphaeria bacterium]